ncbi:MAG: hypothetical protein ABWY65_03020 [Thermoleophilaceae bacterium]
MKVSVNWSAVSPMKPIDPTNPGDPAYDFRTLDRAVRDASAP